VSTVIIAIDNQARIHQCFDQAEIPPYVLTHAMGDLDDAARRFALVPAGATDLQAVRARQLELIRSCEAHEKLSKDAFRWFNLKL